MRKQNKRGGMALRKDARHAYVALLAGAGLGVVVILILCLNIPPGSPKEMVMAQVVRGQSIQNSVTTNGSGLGLGETRNSALASSKSFNGPVVNKPPVPRIDKNEPVPVGFDTLSSFPFVVTDEMADGSRDPKAASLKSNGLIPPRVMALNGKVVALTGFMLPLKFKHRMVTDFLLLRDQNMCCYGAVPKINEWVTVHMADEGVQQRMDQPVTIQGRLHVGEIRENGYLIGIYRLDGERMVASARFQGLQ